MPREVGEPAGDRVGLAVELERRVIGHDRVIRGLRRDEVRIRLERLRIDAGQHGRIQAPMDAEQPTARDMLGKDVVRRLTASTAAPRVRQGELAVRENGMLVEEGERLHGLPIWVDATIQSSCFSA